MTAGYLLTGGRNRRMGGQKKLFLSYEGKAFYQRILEALSPLERVYLSVDETQPYEKVGLPMVADIYPHIGAMGGIYSGLCHCPEDALFVVACDMPHLDRESVCKLIAQYDASPKLTLAEVNGCSQPLFGIYPKSLLPKLEALIANKNYRMYTLLEQTEYQRVALAEHIADNINSIEEYQTLLSFQASKKNEQIVEDHAVLHAYRSEQNSLRDKQILWLCAIRHLSNRG